MDTLLLKRPAPALREAALDYKSEHLSYGEQALPGSALFDSMEFDDWLQLTRNNACETTVRPDWVVSSTFFAVRESDGKIIGMVDIRHSLNAFLAAYGGHIGYGVRPSERRKGYATAILHLALDYAKALGLPRVMLGCHAENTASARAILACGGVLEREFTHTDGKAVQVYWITL